MENYKSHRIARIIALIDQLWSAIDMLLTFITFFGGEKVNGLFYEVELHASLGLIPEEQVAEKKTLTGLFFSLSFVLNVCWIFAAFMLFKGTELKQIERGKITELRYCRIWLGFSVVLLTLHLVNMFLYIHEVLQEALAIVAFIVRASFMYLVHMYMTDLSKFRENLIADINGRSRQLIYIHHEQDDNDDCQEGERLRGQDEENPNRGTDEPETENRRTVVTISSNTTTVTTNNPCQNHNFRNGKSIRIES